MTIRTFVDTDWQLWILLRDVAHKMVRIRNDELRKHGVSFIQAAVLYVLENADGPITPSEISRWLDRKRSTVTEILNRMQRKGLIEKVKDLKQKNQIRIKLSTKGKNIYQKTSDLIAIHRIFAHLSNKDKDKFSQYLTILQNASLEELVDNR